MNSHICHIVNHLNAGGAEQYVVQLSNHLHVSGHRVTIVAGQPQVLRDRLNADIHIETMELHPGPKRSIFNYILVLLHSVRQLVKYFRREQVTVVHTHLAASAFPAWIAAKWCGIPVIHSRMYAGNLGSRFEKLLFFTRIPLIIISRFLVFTRYSEKEVQQQWHVPAEKIILSSIGVDLPKFKNSPDMAASSRMQLGLGGDDRVLLVVSRLHPEKDVELAIRAAKAFNDPRSVLIIVGDGVERKQLEKLADELPGLTRVRFLGLLLDPRPAFAAADLLLQTSRSPNLGMVVLEAMASSLPVIIAYRDQDEYAMAIDTFDGEEVGIVSQATPEAIAASLSMIYSDEVLRQRLCVRSRSFVEVRHSRNLVYSRLSDFYIKLMNF